MVKIYIFYSAVFIVGIFSLYWYPDVVCQSAAAAPDVKRESAAGAYQPLSSAAKHNPFLTEEEEELLLKDKRETINYLEVSGIFYSGNYSYAIIDGRILKEKDIIDNKTITKISREEVTLKDSGENEYFIKVKKIIGQ